MVAIAVLPAVGDVPFFSNRREISCVADGLGRRTRRGHSRPPMARCRAREVEAMIRARDAVAPIFNPMVLDLPAPVEVIPGHVIRAATDSEVALIRDLIARMSPHPSFVAYPY